MSSQPKGYVDTTYLDTMQKLVNDYKRLTYKRMHIKPGQKVLDAGCGPGSDTIPLAQYVRSSGLVIGVDYDENMISEADRRAKLAGVNAWVMHKRADAIELPFESNYFDSCRCERLFQHLPDPMKALSEMVRVTKPGGWIVALDSDWGSLSIDTSEIDIERRLVRFYTEKMTNNGYSGRQLYRLFRQHGLIKLSIQMCGLHTTDYALTRQLLVLDSTERDALSAGAITDQELDRLRTIWEQANTEGNFFASMSMILVSGRKPYMRKKIRPSE